MDDLPDPGTDKRLPLYNGDPPGDSWEAGVDHPPYSECDYNCALCNKPLTDEDD